MPRTIGAPCKVTQRLPRIHEQRRGGGVAAGRHPNQERTQRPCSAVPLARRARVTRLRPLHKSCNVEQNKTNNPQKEIFIEMRPAADRVQPAPAPNPSNPRPETRIETVIRGRPRSSQEYEVLSALNPHNPMDSLVNLLVGRCGVDGLGLCSEHTIARLRAPHLCHVL